MLLPLTHHSKLHPTQTDSGAGAAAAAAAQAVLPLLPRTLWLPLLLRTLWLLEGGACGLVP